MPVEERSFVTLRAPIQTAFLTILTAVSFHDR
jgi:hypothetical protein